MHPFIKTSLTLGTLAGASGAFYGIYSTIKSNATKTYADLLNGTLLTTSDDSYQVYWKARLAALQDPKVNNLVDEIIGLKTKKDGEEQWRSLKDWCGNIINNRSKNKQSKEFQNIQSYCTFSIKEKISNAINPTGDSASDGKWTVAHGKLKQIPRSKVIKALQATWDLETTSGKTKVKEWCIAAYEKPYKGENDEEFSIAKQICIS